MVYCIFTYREDAACLRECVASIRLADDRALIAVLDDAACPLDQEPEDVNLYVRTTFDRQGNLNGIACVAGMLQCYLRVMEHFQCERVVKIDADVVLLRRAEGMCPYPFLPYEYWGFEGPYWGFGCGACYGVARGVARRALDYVKSRSWYEPGNKFPEDATIGRLCLMLSSRWHIAPTGSGAIRGIGAEDALHLAEQADWAIKTPAATALHFGQHKILGHQHLTRAEARQRTADTMRRFRAILGDQCRPLAERRPRLRRPLAGPAKRPFQ